MDRLPNEIIAQILEFLDYISFCRFCRTCQEYSEFLKLPILEHKIHEKYILPIIEHLTTGAEPCCTYAFNEIYLEFGYSRLSNTFIVCELSRASDHEAKCRQYLNKRSPKEEWVGEVVDSNVDPENFSTFLLNIWKNKILLIKEENSPLLSAILPQFPW